MGVDRSYYDASRVAIRPNERKLRTETYLDDFAFKEENEDIAELFHENTKVSQLDPKFETSIQHFTKVETRSNRLLTPSPKRKDQPKVELPEPGCPTDSVDDVIEARESIRTFTGEPLSKTDLSTLLKFGFGTTGEGEEIANGLEFRTRAYPSAGGLYVINPYIVLLNGRNLEEGVYFYSADDHCLRVVRRVDRDQLIEAASNFTNGTLFDYERASALFVLTGSFWKNKIKYGPRGYRFALLEAGHMLQNLQLVATSMGYGMCSLGGLREDEVDTFVEANGVDESMVYGCIFGTPAEEE